MRKRLYISGLSSSDISHRLSSFGSIHSLEGFDKLDGVGQPRGFGYVELETSEERLKKCLSSLSGTMFKGRKIKIAEARPDFRARSSSSFFSFSGL